MKSYNNSSNYQSSGNSSSAYNNNNNKNNNNSNAQQQQQSSVPNYSNVLKTNSNSLNQNRVQNLPQQQNSQQQMRSNPNYHPNQYNNGANGANNANQSNDHYYNNGQTKQPNNYHAYNSNQKPNYSNVINKTVGNFDSTQPKSQSNALAKPQNTESAAATVSTASATNPGTQSNDTSLNEYSLANLTLESKPSETSIENIVLPAESNNQQHQSSASSSTSSGSLPVSPSKSDQDQIEQESNNGNSARLSDLIKEEKDFTDKTDYYRNFVTSVDRVYPEAKFPLRYTWTFGYIKHDQNATSWDQNIKEICNVAYVEDFWSVAQNLLTPTMMSNIGDLTFFKKGIRPMWEDAENKSGGSWLHQITNNNQFNNFNKGGVDDFWIETLIGLIGDTCSDERHAPQDASDYEKVFENISGFYVSHRHKAWKLALWTKNYKDEKTTRSIG
jgi:hypothetical protein